MPTVPDPTAVADPVATTQQLYTRYAHRYVETYRTWVPAAETTDLAALLLEPLADGATVLDVGTGSGRDLGALRDLGADATGVELSPAMAAHARAHGPVIEADMRDLPFEDGQVAGILAAASLLHLPRREAQRALGEFRRVLCDGGRLVVSVKEGRGEQWASDGRYFQLWTAEQLTADLEAAGFDVVEARREPDSRRDGLWWLIHVAHARGNLPLVGGGSLNGDRHRPP